MIELKRRGDSGSKRRAEMSWIWDAPSGLYIVFITKSDDGSFMVKYPTDPNDGSAESQRERVLPSFELAELFALALVDILKTAWSAPDIKVTHCDLRGTPEY